MKIYSDAVGTDDEFSRTLAMKKILGYTDADIKENYENLIKESMLKELAEYYKGQIAEHKGLAGWEPPIKFKDEEDKDEKELEGKGADDEESKESEGSEDEENNEEGNNAEEKEDNEEGNEESAAPTFGLK